MSADRADALAVLALAGVGILALPGYLWHERQARRAEIAEAWQAVFRGDGGYGLRGAHGLDTTLGFR